MSDPVRWGVLGCATIAINHVIPGILQAEGATLTAVASRTLDKAVKVAKQFGAPKAYGSYEALLADPEVEAVYIPLPNGLHKAWSIAAMRAGKDVLCEKPITLNAAEAREVQAVRQETGRLTIEAFAYRFQPLIEKAIEIARSGRLGELQMLHTTMSFKLALNPADVRLQAAIGGGALYDVGCYALNLQRMLVGREPRMAWCKLTWSEQFGVDVSGAGVLDYGQGLLGTFATGFTATTSVFHIEGTKGQLVAPYGTREPAGEAGLWLTVGDVTEKLMVPPANDYMREVQDLSEAIRGTGPARYAHEPLEANMRVIDACFASDRSGVVEPV